MCIYMEVCIYIYIVCVFQNNLKRTDSATKLH